MDWNKGLRNKRAVIDQNWALRNQQLQQQIDATNAGPAPNAIIGGQMVEAGDAAGYNAANAQRNAVAADANARMSLRGKFGSRDVTSMRGNANSAEGGNPVELGQDMAQPQQLQEIQPNGSQLPNAGEVGAPANMGSPSMGMQSTPQNSSLRAGSQPFRNTMSELASDFPEGKPSSIGDALNSGRASFNSTDNPTRSGYGFRNGGSVMDKPRMVKQPGYKNGGKVTLPKETDDQLIRRVAAEGRAEQGLRKPSSPRQREQELNEQRIDAIVEEGFEESMPRKGMAMGGQIGPEVTKWAGEKKKRKGMRGYAVGGKIGKKSEDDGKDTVDVRVREGEYMLNPETVGFMGGGSYEQGVRALDDIVRQATGEEPGPVPVNDEGEAMRGFRNGGKMGYAAGGTMFVNGAGETVQYINGRPVITTPQMPAVVPQQASAGPGSATIDARPLSSSTEALSRGERWNRAGQRAGASLRANPAYQATTGAVKAGANQLKTSSAIVPLVTGGMTAADNFSGAKDAFYDDPNVPEWEKAKLAAGEISSFALPTAGAIVGGALGGGSTFGVGTIAGGVGGGTLGAMADRGIRTALGAPAGGTTAFNEYAANWSPEEVAAAQAAGQTPEQTPEQYYRPFGGGAVDMRDMNVVQQTGGPNGEVIVREDVDGVPTFSNLRTAPQAGDAATLQAQANARAREDVGIREMQNRAVEQMRQNAPVYGNTEAEQLRDAETKARQERALAAAENNPNMSLDDLQGEFESLGMFTDPATGSFSADLFGSFVQQVINPLVEVGQLDPASLTPAQIMQLAVSGQDAMGITGAVNSALTNNDRLPLGGIVTPNMVGPREDASFWGDLGWFNDRSDLGFREAMFGDKRVVQTPDGPITLPADSVGLRNQRQANIYGN